MGQNRCLSTFSLGLASNFVKSALAGQVEWLVYHAFEVGVDRPDFLNYE